MTWLRYGSQLIDNNWRLIEYDDDDCLTGHHFKVGGIRTWHHLCQLPWEHWVLSMSLPMSHTYRLHKFQDIEYRSHVQDSYFPHRFLINFGETVGKIICKICQLKILFLANLRLGSPAVNYSDHTYRVQTTGHKCWVSGSLTPQTIWHRPCWRTI